jgi:Uma2 family endonuclease
LATVLAPADQRIVLRDINWETYERLLADDAERIVPRLTYDQGTLDLMSPLSLHEKINRTIAGVIEVVAAELDQDYVGVGSTTFKRPDLRRGFEPDSSFYFRRAAEMRHKPEIDLAFDPPADLLLELDLTNPLLSKLPLFAAMGIPEVWRYAAERLAILHLVAGDYIEQPSSRALPRITSAALADFLAASDNLSRPTWIRKLRAWARAQRRSDPRSS